MKTQLKKYTGVLLATSVVVAGLASAAATDPIPNPLPNAVAGNVIKASDINDLATAVGILDERTTNFGLNDALSVDSNGYVGIGIADAEQPLHVSSDDGLTEVRIENTASGGHKWGLASFSDQVSGFTGGSFGIADYTAGGWRMLFRENGNVGIGINNPQEKVDVNGEVKAHNFYGDKLEFIPTEGVGWYRVASRTGNISGDLQIECSMDNKLSVIDANFYGRAYLGGDIDLLGSIQVLASVNYNKGPISKIRIGSNDVDGDRAMHVDVFVNSATNPATCKVSNENRNYDFLDEAVFVSDTPTFTTEIDLGDSKIEYSGLSSTDSIYSKESLFADESIAIGTGSPTSKLQVVGLPEYADNAAATAGGLDAGAFYHTAGTLKVVY